MHACRGSRPRRGGTLAVLAALLPLITLYVGCGPQPGDPLDPNSFVPDTQGSNDPVWDGTGDGPNDSDGGANPDESDPDNGDDDDPFDDDNGDPDNEPVLDFSPKSLDFGDGTDRLDLQIRNVGIGTLNYTISAEAGWVSVSPSSGSNSGTTDHIEVAVDRVGLAVGNHQTSVVITTADGATRVPVHASVADNQNNPPPQVQLSPASLDFATSQGPRSFTLQLTTEGSFNFTIVTSAAWLSADPPQGTNAGEVDTITLNVDRGAMGSGVHFATASVYDGTRRLASVTVRADGGGSGSAAFQRMRVLGGGTALNRAFAIGANDSLIVGRSQWAGSGVYEAFRWTSSGGLSGIGELPGGQNFSVGASCSNQGDVIVGTSYSANGYEAFRWKAGGAMQGLGDLPGGEFRSEARAVSANGLVVVGASASAAGTQAFRWTEHEGMVGLGDLSGGPFSSNATAASSDGSVVVGYSARAEGNEAFRWTASGGMTGLGRLSDGRWSEARAVSANGLTVVGVADRPGGPQAFFWNSSSGMVALGDLPGGNVYSVATAVSENGAMVFGASCTEVGLEAFRWTPGQGMRRLQDVLEDDFGLNLSGWTLHSVDAVSPDGRVIVGQGVNPQGEMESWIARLP